MKIIGFFMTICLLLAAIPGAVMNTGGSRDELQTQWRILSGGVWAHREYEYDIIILAGQSNMGGCGLGDVPDLFEPTDLMQLMPQKPNFLGGHTIEKAAENLSHGMREGNIGLIFAREYIRNGLLEPGRKLLLLKAPAGGTGFIKGDWGPDDPLYLNMLKMIDTALALNPANEIKAILWHQGEGEVIYGATYEVHTENFSTFINDTRAYCGNPCLPFIAGDLVEEWRVETAGACEPVSSAMRDVCNNIGSAAFIETDGLTSNYQAVGEVNGGGPDTIHFSKEALYELGIRYFNSYVDIIN
ncbi:MAG: sialate O-acetylesterase [Oscillospiraceae bacterium]|nr:sialate O-acetylesterase [Oscillospiraceae bacterium]